jgi:hypothetical protein
MQGRRPPNAEVGSGSIRVVNERLRRQLLKQRLGLLQIARVKAFGEPAVDRSEEIAGRVTLANETASVGGAATGEVEHRARAE